MNKLSHRLDAGARMALAAYLHDLGKFVERADPQVDKEKLETHLQLYARRQETAGKIWYSHRHAAYTALALEWLEDKMPALKGQDFAPFGTMHCRTQADDSLINAAAKHHKPEGFLQWVVATADRVASGFEREEFDRYNNAEEGTETGRNHYQARLLTLFEQIQINNNRTITPAALRYRYPLKPLSVAAIFPQLREHIEPSENDPAKAEYQQLWQAFEQDLARIPKRHRQQLPLWLDHFDSLWLTYTHAIPSATAFGARPDVSLYDHSKTAAALAVALWRYHHDSNHTPEQVAAAMAARDDWDEEKFLLIQGDFYGVQSFIFAEGAETNKRAAKLLRGRSFYVSLLTECAALAILDELELPSTSQIINAAGKFLIVAPNTPEVAAKLAALQKRLNEWFMTYTFARGGIGLAAEPASCNHFVSRSKGQGFGELMKRLFNRLEQAKFQRFNLCADQAPSAVFSQYLDQFQQGPCQLDGYAPATTQFDGIKLSQLAADQMRIGALLPRSNRLLITKEPVSSSENRLQIPLFGYYLHFTGSEEQTGKFGELAASGVLRRAFDFSLPEQEHQALWAGYARRNINGYIPLFRSFDAQYPEKYQLPDEAINPGDVKTFNHLACEDRLPVNAQINQWQGVKALATLKADVDDLGAIFQKGLARPTFAKMASLSRQMNNFFAVYLPWLCHNQFANTYTVFAGGDDLFLLGPWHTQMRLVETLTKAFTRYTASNPDVHFSAGISITKPGMPIPQLALHAEDALEQAKAQPGKNALTLFGRSLPWARYPDLLQACQTLAQLADEYKLPTAYIYDIIKLLPMLETPEIPEHALWRSRLVYRTWRLLSARRMSPEQQQKAQTEIMKILVENGLKQWGADYRVALQTYLYLTR